MSQQGILYIVATPIGNVNDISSRAQEVLRSVAKIAAEDTRHSRPLLQKLDIESELISYHDFSGEETADAIIKDLLGGHSIALISDAGTPLISDPGFKLVRLARQSGISVIPIPGPSAVTAALSVSGLPTDRFVFEGFLPNKVNARLKLLRRLLKEERTCVFFESTHRIVDCMKDFETVFADDRQVFIAREISKKFETHFLGTASQCCQWLAADSNQRRGEFVIVLEGCAAAVLETAKQEQAMRILALLGDAMSTKDAVSLASEISGARKNLLYDTVLANKSADK